jgi:hypothetical protein
VKAKLALAAVLVTGAAVLAHPAGAKTAARDGVLVLLFSAAGCAVLAAGAFAGARYAGRRADRQRAAAAAGLPRVAACPAGRVTVHTPAGWPRLAPDCGCGRPAAVMVTYPDGRPDQPSCAGCWRDTAVSEARAAGRPASPEPPAPGPVPAAPDNTPGHADMSEFETGS